MKVVKMDAQDIENLLAFLDRIEYKGLNEVGALQKILLALGNATDTEQIQNSMSLGGVLNDQKNIGK